MAVFLSLMGAEEVVFAGPLDFGTGAWEPAYFERRNVLLPDVLIPADVSIGRGMRPAFDLICQSVGLDGSVNYGDDGEWKAPCGRRERTSSLRKRPFGSML